jgi:hypothetical protein
MRLAPVLAGAFLLVGIDSASAATLVQEVSFASTAVPTGGLNTTLTVNKFNVTNATLTAIDLEFTGGVSGTVSLTRTNTGPPSAQSYAVELGADFALTVGPSAVAELLDVVDTETIQISRSGSRTGTASFATSASVTTALAPALFAQFTGPGSVNIALGILRDNQVTGPGNAPLATQTFNNYAMGDLRITFTYTVSNAPVPEPLAVSLFGLGLLSLAAVRRRRRTG